MIAKSAERYAHAAIELAIEQKKQNKVGKELTEFAKFLQSSEELKSVLLKDVFSAAEKSSVLEGLLPKIKVSDLTKKFLLLLAKQNRFHAFFDIQKIYELRMNELEKKKYAEVISAQPLSPAARKKVQKKFETELGQKLEIDYKVEPSLLGGLITKIGNQIYDGSVRTQLSNLSRQLERGV